MGRTRRLLLDGLPALLLLAIGLGGTAPAARNAGLPTTQWWHYLPVVVAALAVAGRRRLPLPTLAVVTAAVCSFLLLGQLYGPILLSLAVALYTVAAHRPLRRSAVAAGVVAVLMVACGLIGTGLGPDVVTPVVAWAAVPLAIGVTVRVTREQRLANRRDEIRRQADAERLRVAQEVHDVVGHGLAAITMQADIALHVLAKRPGDAAQAEAALTAISRTSRESLDELRVTLGAVRRGAEADDRSPAPGLARLDALIDRTRSVGVPVSVAVEGPVTGLPAAVDLAAYRIVQEAMTNVLRHAGTATAAVRVAVTDAEVEVEVTDTGRGGEIATGGHGLAGMRERVTALGGKLSAGPSPAGGFTVHATIPRLSSSVERSDA
ncbi:sensor histidine kinase [Actinoplanes sp. NPDC051633]|uniref:sensor histidine kinase n=1 Tax=Actinoplanes sp. NPDC051633 TaxID=3155670 RepID=UPI00342C44FE